MIDTSNYAERFLQYCRFRKVRPYLKGDVMDFGGNEGELRRFVRGDYLPVNYNHRVMEGRTFDTIVAMAVIEHIEPAIVHAVFLKFAENHLRPDGHIFLTTPTPLAKPILEVMARVGILQRSNIAEHKHYWTKKDIYDLA
ncbi:MAG: methyltransferase domain-containing protein, partial [Patescibacteria group bacterium]|nr:methyltransferase domain-containing protein [Patescibacteria group bacterium]